MKKILYCLLVAVMLSACGGDSKQENAPRKDGEKRVGDIVMVDGEFGVVFAVTTDGRHGKAVSVSETKCDWRSAKTWCTKLSYSWRLPTKDELMVVYRKKSAVNSALSDNGYEALSSGWHWASESNGEACAWSVYMGNGSSSYGNKNGNFSVRAVCIF